MATSTYGLESPEAPLVVPPPAPARARVLPFDPLAARAALARVDLTMCRMPAPPSARYYHADVTFAEGGDVSDVRLAEADALADDDLDCVGEALRRVRIPSFGPSRPVRVGTMFLY